ncbi:MAG: hypothetical protein EBX03_10760, partial [Rhodobacteraceae bacterium]|nr:hypothetical protein [Paracoccaceae bacterium]
MTEFWLIKNFTNLLRTSRYFHGKRKDNIINYLLPNFTGPKITANKFKKDQKLVFAISFLNMLSTNLFAKKN